MKKEEKRTEEERLETKDSKEKTRQELSPTWATECIEDIDDWIESQGIYLRQ